MTEDRYKEVNDNHPENGMSAYETAGSTVQGAPRNPDELRQIDSYWRASLYVCLGMLYLQDNPLLREPLKIEHNRLTSTASTGPTSRPGSGPMNKQLEFEVFAFPGGIGSHCARKTPNSIHDGAELGYVRRN